MDSRVSDLVHQARWSLPALPAMPCHTHSLFTSGHVKLHTIPGPTCSCHRHLRTECLHLFYWPTPILPSGSFQLFPPPHRLSKLNRRVGYPTLLPQQPVVIPILALPLYLTPPSTPTKLLKVRDADLFTLRCRFSK